MTQVSIAVEMSIDRNEYSIGFRFDSRHMKRPEPSRDLSGMGCRPYMIMTGSSGAAADRQHALPIGDNQTESKQMQTDGANDESN